MNVKIILIGFLINTNLLFADIIDLKKFIKDLENKNENEKIYLINSEINKYEYKSDKDLYGKQDHWAKPSDFFKNKAGDCEDYAIAKYALLKKAGFKESNMKLIFTTYKYKTGKIEGHLVLEVLNKEGKKLILDNTKIRPIEEKIVFQNNRLKKELEKIAVLNKIKQKDILI